MTAPFLQLPPSWSPCSPSPSTISLRRTAPRFARGSDKSKACSPQICLSTSNLASSPSKRRSVAIGSLSTADSTLSQQAGAKELGALKEDPAFREFFKLQEGFEWNGMSFYCNRNRHSVGDRPELTISIAVAIRLITALDRLLGKGSNGQNDLLILSTLDLIQGTLLLHPPSRTLFAREIYMNVRLPQ